uniref:Uncharacterized protein n=1 Tax=uncultured prokaryote TaxID=198431 RepID=A0A0H5QPN6_9ZZZZ|nr:hypothetical protein [uncultured prokaryote]
MAIPVVPNVYRTRSEFTAGPNGTAWSVTMDFYTNRDPESPETNEAAIGAGVVNGWADIFDETAFGTNTIDDYFHEDVQLSAVVVQALDGVTAQEVITPAVTVSGAGADAMPALVSLAVSKRTKVRGGSHRGRVYLSGLSQQGLVSATGGVSGDFRRTLAEGFTDHLMSLSATAEPDFAYMVVVGSPGGSGYIETPVISLTCDNRWDTQKRRVA